MENNKIREASFKYDENGYDEDGFDKNGRNAKGFDREGYNSLGLNEQGFYRDGYNRRGFDKDGYDSQGYNDRGYNRDGFNRSGLDATGVDKFGFDRNHNYRKPKPADDKLGRKYDIEGFDYQGYDPEGFNRDGINEEGFTKDQVEEKNKLIEDITLLNTTINTMKNKANEATTTLVNGLEIDGEKLKEYISKLSLFDGMSFRNRTNEELSKLKNDLTDTIEKNDWDKFKFSEIKDEILIKTKYYLDDLKSLDVEYKDLKVEEPDNDLSKEDKFDFYLTQLLAFFNTRKEKVRALNTKLTFNNISRLF